MGSYTRNFSYDTNSNRLESTTIAGDATYTYDYDAHGNQIEFPHLASVEWNALDQLSKTEKGSEPTYYQYDGSGQRVRKYTDKGSIKEERIYLGSFEIYRKFTGTGSLTVERRTVHIADDTGRIAMYEKRTVGTGTSDGGTAAELIRYIYSNHLQSASLELDDTGEARGFKAENKGLGKWGPNKGKPIGMSGEIGGKKIGFRIEYDGRSGAHINVFFGKEKGPHFTFQATESVVNQIIKRFSR